MTDMQRNTYIYDENREFGVFRVKSNADRADMPQNAYIYEEICEFGVFLLKSEADRADMPQNAHIYKEICEFGVFHRKSKAILKTAGVSQGRTSATCVFLKTEGLFAGNAVNLCKNIGFWKVRGAREGRRTSGSKLR